MDGSSQSHWHTPASWMAFNKLEGPSRSGNLTPGNPGNSLLSKPLDRKPSPAQSAHAKDLESATVQSNLQTYENIAGRDEHPELSSFQQANLPAVESKNEISSWVDVERHDLSTSQEPSGLVERDPCLDPKLEARKGFEIPATSQVQPSSSSHNRGEKLSAIRRARTAFQRVVKPYISRSKTFPLERRGPGTEQTSAVHSLVRHEDTHSGTVQADVEARKECERPAFSQDQPSPTNGKEKSNAMRRVLTMFRGGRGGRSNNSPGREGSGNEKTKTSQQANLDRHGETLSRTMQPENSFAATRAQGDKLKLTDDNGAKHTTREGEEIEKLRRDLSDSRSHIAELQRRCEAQSKELQGSSGFFSTADKSSDSDIIRACQRLNAELQQNTTYMAECLKEAFEFQNLATNPMEEQVTAVQRVSDQIGPVLARGLEENMPANLTMLLQTAFQARLASALSLAVSSWALEPGHNTFISGIYQRLRSVEAQAISGRWRVLARVHTYSWSTQPESLVSGIIAGISDILLAAGCTAPQVDITSKVTSRFKDTIAALVELAVRLGQMFDEVISSDFEVFLPRPGEKFEDNMMEDVDGDRAGMPEALVLCATNLGLIKRTPVGTSLWVKGRKEKITVLKPQVLLESSLDADE